MYIVNHNWCPLKVHFRANVIAYRFIFARKWTIDGHQFYTMSHNLCDIVYISAIITLCKRRDQCNKSDQFKQ